MKAPFGPAWVTLGFLLLLSTCESTPIASQSVPQDFIVTAAPAYEPLAALRGRERFPRGAQLLLVHQGRPEPLVPALVASADANISYDGKFVLFSGKKTAAAPWQIFELTLSDRSIRAVTTASTDSIRPFYLPAGRFVYAQRTGALFQLHSSRILDSPAFNELEPGTKADLPIAFLSANVIPSDVLADGRILFESNFPLGSGSTPELFLVYSDGSGVESYRCDHGTSRWGGHQLASGDIVFTHGASLARFTSPLAHEVHISAPAASYSGAIAETPSGDWLLSVRATASAPYAIHQWKPGSATSQSILQIPGQNLVDPVLVAPRNRPHRHPSALHPWDYANLLALDARISREGTLKTQPATVRLETQDSDGGTISLGTAPIEPDGSFFVKVPGDKPIRFAVLDARGTVLRQEHGWFWARSGEQRYCVGCHAGPEHAPENHVPAVLLRSTEAADLTRPALSAPTRSIVEGSR
ncbi:MAG TPA: hypothetical protein VK716_16705 [Terracidiphilus sp.]|jgi:hypothetical protein|nr:hypothetical protein [Terracidiphilus sp.]